MNAAAFVKPMILWRAVCLSASLVAGSGCAVAQPAAQASVGGAATPSRSEVIASERSRIAAERTQQEDGFLAEDRACYQRFAVNSCLDDVNKRRRAVVSELRRQEILLNDEERKARGADQVRKTEEKNAPDKQREAAERRAKAIQDHDQRLADERQKQSDRGAAQAAEPGKAAAAASKQQDKQSQAQGRAQRQGEAAENARKFAERQKEAAARRADHDAEQARRTKPAGNPLPTVP